MKPRFSLKTLLVLITFAALFCFWRTRPAEVAERFQDAIEAKDFAAADGMIGDETHRTLAKWDGERRKFSAQYVPVRQTFWDWLCGRQRGAVTVRMTSGLTGLVEATAPAIALAGGVTLEDFAMLKDFGSISWDAPQREVVF